MLGSSHNLWPFFEVKKPEEATSVEGDQEAEQPTEANSSEEPELPETATKTEESGEAAAVGATTMESGSLAT